MSIHYINGSWDMASIDALWTASAQNTTLGTIVVNIKLITWQLFATVYRFLNLLCSCHVITRQLITAEQASSPSPGTSPTAATWLSVFLDLCGVLRWSYCITLAVRSHLSVSLPLFDFTLKWFVAELLRRFGGRGCRSLNAMQPYVLLKPWVCI